MDPRSALDRGGPAEDHSHMREMLTGGFAEAASSSVEPPVVVARPNARATPLVFASPHSGRHYPDDFVEQAVLDPVTLRASEDAFVDELFAAASRNGAPFVQAQFPRAYVDANRDPWELDPTMFRDRLPAFAKTRTPRVAAGLGAVPRIVADGAEIYAKRLSFRDAERRIRTCHTPYHEAVEAELAAAREQFGVCVLIDCHSMPSVGGPGDDDAGRGRKDVVLGDRFGAACRGEVTETVAAAFREAGFSVGLNAPYAGGWSTERYGRPGRDRHALQIELNRGLYLDETNVERGLQFDRVAERLAAVVAAVTQVDWAATLAR